MKSYLLKKIEINKNKYIRKLKDKNCWTRSWYRKRYTKISKRQSKHNFMLRFLHMFMYNTETLIAKYSLGSHPDEMIEDYLNGIEYLENVGEEKSMVYWSFVDAIVRYTFLEVDKQDLKRLACVIEKQKKRRRTARLGVKIKLCLVYNKITKEAGNYG